MPLSEEQVRRRQGQEWWALALVLLVGGLLVAGLAWQAHQRAGTAERQRLEAQSQAMQRILDWQIESAYAAMLDLRDELTAALPGADTGAVSQRLKLLSDAIPGLGTVAWLDASGRVRAASQPALAGSDLSSSLPATLPPAADPDRLHVTPPLRDSSGALAIDLVLAMPGGAVLARLDAEYFGTVLRAALYAADMRAWLLHGDGGVLMVEPPRPLGDNENAARPGSFFERHRASGRELSTFSGDNSISGERRLAVFRTLKPGAVPMQPPLVLATGRNLDAIHAPWREQWLANAGLFAVFVAGMASALALLQRRQRELQALQREGDARSAAQAERLAMALRGADLGLWDLDLDSGVATVNARWSEMLGYAEGEIDVDSAGWRALVHPDDLDRVWAAQQAHIGGRSPVYDVVYRMRHKDGRWVWILDRGKVLTHDADGRPLRMLGTHMDISARMEAEQALRRSEESLAITLHSIGDAVIATDEQGIVTRLNAAAVQLTGWLEAEALGRPLAEVFRIHNPHTGEAVTNPVQEVLQRGEVVGLANDTVLVARDGRSVQIADSAAPIRTADGRVIGVVLVFSDVSERYAAQQALRDREHQLSAITGALPGPVSRADAAGRYLFANAAYRRWFGLSGADVVGHTQREVLGERRYASVAPYVQRVLQGETVRYEHPVRTPEGEQLYAMVLLVPDRDGDGRVRGHFTIVTDITERKRAEDALRESERKSRALVDNLMVGVVVHAPDTQVLDANPAACRMLGLSLDQMLGKVAIDPAWHFIGEDNMPLSPEQYPVNQVVASGQPLSDCIGGIVRPELGAPFWVLCNAFPVRRADGSIEQILVTFLDITERRVAELERQALERQLRESQRMEAIGTLAGGIAHDFNNILAAILGNVALAGEDIASTHPAQASLTQIRQAGLRARSLVQQILTFSRRDSGALEVQPLRSIVEETLALLRATLPAAVRLEATLPDAPVPVRADATQLQQVLMNLATNAWHAMPDGGRLEIGIERLPGAAADGVAGAPTGAVAHLWVCDDGSGMDEATRARIFDPFFTTKPVGQGTGLGLSVVHGIVRAHQGRIEVDSAPGRGSTFHLYFPSPELPAVAAAPAAAAPRTPGGGERVLFVDDDEVLLLLIERLLQRAGYRVDTCNGGDAALARLQAEAGAFDVVVTDFNMPGMSGIELARRVAALRPDLPVVLSSGLVSESLREQAREVGVRAVVRKETSFDELAETVARVLAHV